MATEDSGSNWREKHVETALQVAERHRQLAEQQLMPTIAVRLPEMQQFVDRARLVAKDVNETLENYRQKGYLTLL